MKTLDIIKAQFEEQRTWWGNEPADKYEWVAHRVFDLTTYDSSLDKLFVKDIIEIIWVILERHNYEYVLEHEDYIRFVLVCQLLNKFNWIDWGTSIRGAWFRPRDNMADPKDILDELEWWGDEHHVIEKVPFSVENIKALVEFMEED